MTRHASFWDRRRAAVQAEEEQARARAEIETIEAAQADKTDEELLAELGLPDPDTLISGDDFKAFMVKTVPAHLRRRALRRLWVSKPVLACLDDLVDYADDYTQAAAVTDFTTSYTVGKGLRRHVEDIARKAAESLIDSPAPQAEPEPAAEPEEPADTVLMAEAEPQTETVEDVAPQTAPRRMTFRFEEQGA